MAQACKSFKRLLSMTTYLNLGFACHAKGNLLLSPSLSGLQPLCYPASNRHPHFSYCPCFTPATLSFRFITRKETLDTCCKSRQGSTSSLNSPFFLSFSSKSRREPGLGQILGELPPRMEKPAVASTPKCLPSSLRLEHSSAHHAMSPSTSVVLTSSILHGTP